MSRSSPLTLAQQDRLSAFEAIPDFVALVDAKINIRYANAAVKNVLGWRPKDMLDRPFTEFMHPAEVEGFTTLFTGNDTTDAVVRCRHKDATWRMLHIRMRRCAEVPWCEGTLAIARDITSLITFPSQESGSLRPDKAVPTPLLRALGALAAVNAELTNATDEPALLNDVCMGIVKAGGYRVAKICYRQPGERMRLKTVAQVGMDAGGVRRRLSGRRGKRNGDSIALAAIRTSLPQVMRGVLYRSTAEDGGCSYKSSLALPLKRESRPFGVLLIHAAESSAFDDQEVKLLTELANNLSLGLVTLQARIKYHVQQQALDKSHQQLHALVRRAISLQEDERRNIAAELHDHVGQNLTALSMNLSMVEHQLQENTAKCMPALDPHMLADSRRLLEAIGKSVRDVIAEMRPAVLDDYGLIAALRWKMEELEKRTGIVGTVSGPAQRLDPTLETALLRVAQEAFANTAKHAAASRLSVVLRITPRGGALLIEDDGYGFDSSSLGMPGKRSRWGLIMMRERIEAAGGRLRIRSAPNSGTRIVAAWRKR